MDAAQKFKSLFAGLERAYGTYDNVGKIVENNGKLKGDPLTKKAPVTLELWQKHLDGVQGLGIVPIRDDSTCVFGAIDIDSYTDFDIRSMVHRVKDLKLPLVVCRSKSGGAHLYCFSQDPVQASDMRARLQEMASILGHAQAEIFPKQSKILADRGDVGGWINMPYFNGVMGMRYAVKEDGDAMEVEEFIGYATSARMTVDFFLEPLTRESKDLEEGPPCLQHLVQLGFPQGTRNVGLYNIAVYLRKVFGDNWENKLDEYNTKYMVPPVDSQEVRGIVKSVAKKDYQYTCSKQPIVAHCNSMVCRTRKYGVGGGGQGTFPKLGQLRKLLTNPPIWFWDVDEQPVELSTEELQSPRLFQKRVMERCSLMPMLPSQNVWQQLVQAAMQNCVPIDAPVDASQEGQFWEHVESFCTGRRQANSEDELLVGKPWTFDGKTYFRSRDLIAFLEDKKFKEFKPHKIASVLREKGAEHVFKVLKGKGTNLWVLPSFDKPMDDLDLPESVRPQPEVF